MSGLDFKSEKMKKNALGFGGILVGVGVFRMINQKVKKCSKVSV